MTCKRINWKSPIWSTINLKAYIRKKGNPIKNMNDMSKTELVKAAACTERARALIEEDDEACKHCKKIIDDCICERCPGCYDVVCECESIRLVKRFVVQNCFE